MNIYYDIESPAWKEAGQAASDFGLKNHGILNPRKVYWNLPTGALYEEAIFRGEGRMAHHGPLVVLTGKHTGRSAADKYIVREQKTEEHVWWGEYNRPYNPENFNALLTRMQAFFQGRDVFVQDLYAGADPDNTLPVRVITEKAWHSLFVRTMFLKPRNQDAQKKHVPEFTIICAPVVPGQPAGGHDPQRDLHHRQLLGAAGPDRRLALRRRDQEDHLHGAQLPAAARGRHVDALLGQRRAQGRHGAVLRPLGHRQDHAFGRPEAPADRRRRARLERQRHLQLRGRLLRQGHPLVALGRAADLRLHAPLRHHHRKRGAWTR